MARIRIQRMEKELLRILSSTINYKLRDKYLKFVTLTEIKLSNDMSHAKIYYSHLDQYPDEKIQQALTKSTGFLKKEIAYTKLMRVIPELSFRYDKVEEQARNIDKIFDRIKSENHKKEN